MYLTEQNGAFQYALYSCAISIFLTFIFNVKFSGKREARPDLVVNNTHCIEPSKNENASKPGEEHDLIPIIMTSDERKGPHQDRNAKVNEEGNPFGNNH
mmetsp:Transcript_3244/g.4721  ORF Transcript_3244/g.4721 Transcript_3244/m.4721 type:complete len:99 (+) Transcript_3244:434-730(+)